MNTFYVGYYTFIRNIRNTKAMLFFAIFPLLLMYVMGITSSGGGVPRNLSPLKTGILIVDNPRLLQLLEEEQDKGVFYIKKMSSYDEGLEGIKKGSLDCFIYYGDLGNSNQKKEEIKKSAVKVVGKDKLRFLEPVIERIVNKINILEMIEGNDDEKQIGDVSENIEEISVTANGKAPKPINNVTIGGLLIFVFYGSLLGSYSIIGDYDKNTYTRLKSTPLWNAQNILGKIAGSTATLWIVFIFNMIFSAFVYGVYWGIHLPFILFGQVLYIITAVSLGIILTRFTRNMILCGLILFIVNYFCSNIAFVTPGKYSELNQFAFLTPHYYLVQVINGSILDAPREYFMFPLAILLAMAFVTVVTALVWEGGPCE